MSLTASICEFSHDIFLLLPFLESKCETQTRGNELIAGPRIFTSKANMVVKNQEGRTGANWHRISKM